MGGWVVERVINFDFSEKALSKDGFVHFGFHDREGNHYVLDHQKHVLGLLNEEGGLAWTAAKDRVFEGVPNIEADLNYPIYVDALLDGNLVVSNFGDGRLVRIDPRRMEAKTFFEGARAGIRHAGNCVVDEEGCVWLNEVDGCKIWKLDHSGRAVVALGDGVPGFQPDPMSFSKVRFNWIYDLRRGPDGNIYVLDSRNFAVRMIDVGEEMVATVAGKGTPGYAGDGGDPRLATFGGDRSARFDGPISLSLDEEGNIYVGDRFNRVVRMINKRRAVIQTIAGDAGRRDEEANAAHVNSPMSLNLPQISSMDYYEGRLYVPTDLAGGHGDLAVLKKRL